MAGTYTPRMLDPVITGLVAEFPAVMLVGPRAVGKTTTARQLARSVVRLDSEADAAAFRADPDAALKERPEPLLVDEWQLVPQVLGAIKRILDDIEFRPGRFLITGSVRANLDLPTWPGTGRIIPVTMHGLTIAERLGRIPSQPFLDRLSSGGIDAIRSTHTDPYDLRDYLRLAVDGGYPEPLLQLPANRRGLWADGYLSHLVTRDAAELDVPRNPDRLRAYLEAAAIHTAGVVEHKALYGAAGVHRDTGVAYEQLLRNLLVLDAVPAWWSLRVKRLTRSPKRYLTDCSLSAQLLGVDADGIMRSGPMIGRFLDTFVAAQLRAELPRCQCRPRLYHLRQKDGRHEVDLLAEVNSDQVIGIEVKAGPPTTSDAKHLAWLRDELGDQFLAGVILHTGNLPYKLGDRIIAAPISTLWTE